MPTGLIDNIAFGGNDVYLIGNPQVTFFQIVYRRHTNFSKETIMVPFTQIPQFGKKTSITIPQYGDLIQEIYLEVYLPTLSGNPKYIYGVGNALIKTVDLEIGGNVIDRHYADWLNIWGELTTLSGQSLGYDKMVGNQLSNYGESAFRCYVPLRFFFNRNYGLALPLVALSSSEVKLNFEFNTAAVLGNGNSSITESTILDAKLYVDYVYLDIEERKKFATKSHDYLIETLQYNGDLLIPSGTVNYLAKLNLRLPVKELIWICNSSNSSGGSSYYGTFDYSLNAEGAGHTFTTTKIQMSGQDRMITRYADYYYLVQNYQRHTHVPRTKWIHNTYTGSSFTLDTATYNYRNFIYTYSFAISPENHQPTGHCNFSRLNSTQMSFVFPTTSYNFTLKIFAVSYNILQIKNGMVGVSYSN